MIATMSVTIQKKDVINRYKAAKKTYSRLTVDEFIFNYVLERIENNGFPATGTYNKIKEILQKKELV